MVLVPRKNVPLRKPGTEHDPNYDLFKDVEVFRPLDIGVIREDEEDESPEEEEGWSTRGTVMVVLTSGVVVTLIAVVIYLLFRVRQRNQKTYLCGNRRNVLTFSNPNYNASGTEVGTSGAPPQNNNAFIWKRLKYDKSQVRINYFPSYDDEVCMKRWKNKLFLLLLLV